MANRPGGGSAAAGEQLVDEAAGSAADLGFENVLAKGTAVAGNVWQNGEPTWVTDLSTDESMAHGAWLRRDCDPASPSLFDMAAISAE